MSERFTSLSRRRIVGIAIIGIAIISPLRAARAAPPDVRLALPVGTPRIERVDESFTAVLSDDDAIVHAELLPSGELLLEPRAPGTVRVLLFATRLVRALEISASVPLPAIDPAPAGLCAKPRITPSCYAAWRLHLQHLPAADAPPIEFEIEGVQEQIRQAQSALTRAGLTKISLAVSSSGVRLKGVADPSEERRALQTIWPWLLGPLRIDR